MKHGRSIILNDLAKDYPEAEKYITEVLKNNRVPRMIITETMFVIEALCYDIFAQNRDEDFSVTVSSRVSMGDTSILLSFGGKIYDPESLQPAEMTPEGKIFRAYADRISCSYRTGYNWIEVEAKRSITRSIMLSLAAVLASIALYSLLHMTVSEETCILLADNIVFPLELLYRNVILLVGTPVTFLSLLKHLSDTYIVSERIHAAKNLHKDMAASSACFVILAMAAGTLLTKVLHLESAISGEYVRFRADIDPEILIPSLIPSDIFAAFQSVLPFALIILAGLSTIALCSVGRYYDRIRESIDAWFAFFTRMLNVVMQALPFFVFVSIMDELLYDGFRSFLWLTGIIAMTLAGSILMLAVYIIRLKAKGIHPVPFLKKASFLLKENLRIASAIDAAPFNIRYCAKNLGLNRKRLEATMPVMAQMNLDGNCFIITLIGIMYIALNSEPLSVIELIAVGVLIFFLSLGAPNQPGSCIISLTMVMLYFRAESLTTIAIIAEAFLGGILNITNITGDIVTAATEEIDAGTDPEHINSLL